MTRQEEMNCLECNGQTVMFQGTGMDIQYKICSRYEREGHLTEGEITTRIHREQSAIRPAGRWA